VNLFISSEVKWNDRGVTVKQETQFPNEDGTRLTFALSQPTELSLKIRHPAWSDGALKITVNGEPVSGAAEKNSYVEVKRTWKTGDKVDVTFNLTLRTESLPGVKDEVALLYGPIVLAGKLGTDGMPSPYQRDQLDQVRFPHPAVPSFVSADADFLSHVKMISRSPLLFETQGLAKPREVVLEPFYLVQHERDAVYWKVATPETWAKKSAAIEATETQWKNLSTSAVDFVTAGDVSAEAAHGFQGGATESGEYSGRGWREAQKGNAFSYRLKTKRENVTEKSDAPLTLVCAFGSRDKGRKFSLLVDDKVIAMPKLDGTSDGEIILQNYSIPEELTRGKDAVTVKFASENKWDGATANVFGVALVDKS